MFKENRHSIKATVVVTLWEIRRSSWRFIFSLCRSWRCIEEYSKGFTFVPKVFRASNVATSLRHLLCEVRDCLMITLAGVLYLLDRSGSFLGALTDDEQKFSVYYKTSRIQKDLDSTILREITLERLLRDPPTDLKLVKRQR